MGLCDVAEAALQRLLDEAACRRILMRYGPALDWHDMEALQDLFWPDAMLDYGFISGSALKCLPILLGADKGAQRRFHLIGGEVLTWDGNDVAHAESCGITQAIAVTGSGQTSSVFYGRYLDRFERRSSEWRIASRRYLLHGVYTGPYVEADAIAGLPKADGLGPLHPLFHWKTQSGGTP